jgi:hypothetical protein
LKLAIPHATSNFLFWGSYGMGLGKAFAICKSFKLKDYNASKIFLDNLGLEGP